MRRGPWLERTLAIALALTTLVGCAAPLRMARVPAPEAPGFARTVAAVSSSMTARGRVTHFWCDPDSIYAARLEDVRQARRTIHFETYFMTPGRRADDFAAALIERARAGVTVRFLADADGAKEMPPSYWQRLADAGVEVRLYHPFQWHQFWTYNTRTHRKLLLIDGKVGFTGGTGVSDHWDGHEHGAPWCDVELRLEGPVITKLEGIFAQHWTYVGGLADLGPEVFRDHPEEGALLLVTPSSPTDGDSPVRALYHTSLRAAQQRIWIASPYFLPSPSESKALAEAKRRGVDVRVLSVGPKNDKRPVYRAVQEHVSRLVLAGVPILEYQPAMMHAKVMLVDERWVVTGSANFDPRSFYHNDELTIATDDAELAGQVEAFFQDAFAQSRPLTRQYLDNRDFWTQAEGKLTLLLWWFL